MISSITKLIDMYSKLKPTMDIIIKFSSINVWSDIYSTKSGFIN